MANKRRTRTSTKLSTFGTEFGSVIRFNSNNFNSISFSLILDKTLQLKETPITNPVVHSFSSPDFSDSLEVFQNNFTSVKTVHNLLADAMIDCPHKPLLPSRNLFEKSSGTSCAFALQFTPQEFEFPFNLFDFRRFEELPVRGDSKIINPQVHTENSVRTRTHGAFLGECEQEEAFTFRINPQKALINFPTEIIFETIRNVEWNFDSPIYCGNAENIILKGKTSRRIISNGTKLNNWIRLSPLNNPTRLFNARNSELRRQSHFSQFTINKRMKLNIISDFHSPSHINTMLHSFFVGGKSINNLLSWFNPNFSSCSGSHGFYTNSNYLNLLEGISPPNPEGMGIRNANIL